MVQESMNTRSAASVIDLVICTYNNVSLLERTLCSIAEQRVSPSIEWTVTIVDNNCTDDTPTLIEHYISMGKIPHLRRIVEPKQGLTYARICGICNTTAPWIAFVDDDNLLSPDYIEQAVAFAYSHPHCGAFGARVILEPNFQAPLPVEFQHLAVSTQDFGGSPVELPRTGLTFLIGAGLTINREAVLKSRWLEKQFLVGREGSRLSGGEDIELVLRIRKAGYELWYNPGCIIKHVVPLKRATEEYLYRIVRANAACSTHLSGMCPNRQPYSAWLMAKFLRILYLAGFSSTQLLKAKLGLIPRISARVTWYDLLGRIDGLFAVMRMPPDSRREWFGCAKV